MSTKRSRPNRRTGLPAVSSRRLPWRTPIRLTDSSTFCHYRFELTLSDSTDEITGTATMRAQFTGDGVRRLRLDLVSRNRELDGRGMQVHAVTSDGTALRFDHEQRRARIDLPAAPGKGESASVTVTYSGIPATGLVIADNKHGDRTFFQRQLAEQGATLAADGRPHLRQGHQRIAGRRTQPLPGRVERAPAGAVPTWATGCA